MHVSQLAHKFVSDAREIVNTGDIVKFKVMQVDIERKRIGLSMKLADAPARRDELRDNRFEGAGRGQPSPRRQGGTAPQSTAMASAFSKLQGLGKQPPQPCNRQRPTGMRLCHHLRTNGNW